ncbi:pentapeptide repeat-containing protein [Pantoea sp. y20]
MNKKTKMLDQVAGSAPLDLSDFDIPEEPLKEEHQRYNNQHFTAIIVEKKRYIDCHFTNVTFEQCHFRKLHFERCVMDNVSVLACNVSEINLVGCEIKGLTLSESRMERGSLQQCELMNTHWLRSLVIGFSLHQVNIAQMILHEVQLSGWSAVSSSLYAFKVTESIFNDGGWFKTQLMESEWQGSSWCRQAMIRCVLDRVNYRNCDCAHAIWNDCDLVAVNLASLPLGSASFIASRLSNSDLSHSDMVHAVMTKAKVRNCSFKQATLSFCQSTDAIFDDCDFSGARFDQAQLAGVTMVRCNVQGGDFSYADLRQAQVSEVAFYNLRSFLGARLHGATGITSDNEAMSSEPLLSQLEVWYRINQPGVEMSAEVVKAGGSRYV